jgi:hypothetical protein
MIFAEIPLAKDTAKSDESTAYHVFKSAIY